MRAQWSEHEARAVIAAWRRSGLSVERFAQARGLAPQRIFWWRRKLEPAAKELAKVGGGPELLPVQVTKASTLTRSRGEPVMVMLRSGHALKVGRGFDEEAFARAVAVLEGA